MLIALIAFSVLCIALGLFSAIWPARVVEWSIRLRREMFGARVGGIPGLTTARVGGILIALYSLGMIVLLLTVPNAFRP